MPDPVRRPAARPATRIAPDRVADPVRTASPGLALVIGPDSGRDLAALAAAGFAVVVAGEMTPTPVGGLVRQIDDMLPDLVQVQRLGLTFERISLGPAWRQVPPPSRGRAFRRLAVLLKPGGVLRVTTGPASPHQTRPSWPAPLAEIEALARSHGLVALPPTGPAAAPGIGEAAGEATGTSVSLRAPDDATAALPLLRALILHDDKSSTYKLALLRSLARIAEATPFLATDALDGDAVQVPLGLVALNWLRQYVPLVTAGLPQRPGRTGLRFAKTGFHALVAQGVPATALRLGMRFAGSAGMALVQSLAAARTTITTMPVAYLRIPDTGEPLLIAAPRGAPRSRGDVVVTPELLAAFGTLQIPGPIWRALQRLGPWIDAVLVGEWARLVQHYGDRLGLAIPPGLVAKTLLWSDPLHDTHLARTTAARLLAAGTPLHCVWTGCRLKAETLDIDHCLPWSIWPCEDLWNLVPASPRVNRDLKRGRLPAAATLAAARPAIIAWWQAAWDADPLLAQRFAIEAAAALPTGGRTATEAVFAGLEWRQWQLQRDLHLPLWHGPRGG